MKKILLLSCFLMLSLTYLQAQIIVYCESPASVAGNKAFTWADPAGGWGTKDLNNPIYSVKDTLMLMSDGTTGDTLGCNPQIVDLTGKIAVCYRGSCEFGKKVQDAQAAGAIGCIIINHSGDPVAMGPGANGATDTIPSVMINTADGAALWAKVKSGVPVVVFIGNKFGLYPNDLGFYAVDALTSRVTANPALVSASATEFNVPMGAWVHNYGNTSQSNITLSGVISGAATYSAAATPVTLAPGDSVYATIPTYSAASYNGFYQVNYDVSDGIADDFNADNSFYSSIFIDSLFSYTSFDATTHMPKNSVNLGTYAAPFPADYKTCIHFRDPNASRIAAMGLYAAAGTNITLDLSGETIDGLVYEWNDVFTGLSDVNFPASPWTLNQIGMGSYTYPSNQQGEMVYIPFLDNSGNPTAIPMQDNKRYLFCSRTYNSTAVQLGFDTHFNYTELINGNDQPISLVIQDTSYYATGFGVDYTSSITPKFRTNDMGVHEIGKSFEVTPYPNPATDIIKIPLKGMNGIAQLKIVDINGKVVSTQTVKVSDDLTVNVAGVPGGNYVFNMLFNDGRNTSFKVVITK